VVSTGNGAQVHRGRALAGERRSRRRGRPRHHESGRGRDRTLL